MSELLNQLWTPELQAAFTVVVVLLVILYVLSIVWVVRDAYLRGSYWYVWAIVALVPLLGIIAYCLLRPPRRAGAGDRAEAARAHEVRRVRELRLPGGSRLRAVPELPPASQEPLRHLQPRARPHLDRVPVLRHARCRWSAHASCPAAARRSNAAAAAGGDPAADEAGAPRSVRARRAVTTSQCNRSRLANNGAASLFCRKGGRKARSLRTDRAGALCAPGTGKEQI